MYIPKHFNEARNEKLHSLIEAYPLASLVTLKECFPEVNHIPMLLSRTHGSYGLLSGHIARNNLLWQEHPINTEVLVTFQGPNAYISPSWYALKAETGKVVPTWNFISVQARGHIRFIHDSEWLLQHLDALTTQHEKQFAHPWHVADAPADFTQSLTKAIVGFEIQITELKGKFKVSQNRSASDIQSVIKGLSAIGNKPMVDFVKAYAPVVS
ncbi:MAG: FMN-binding negative transcriptional regulator [Pseudomonadota bacterium]